MRTSRIHFVVKNSETVWLFCSISEEQSEIIMNIELQLISRGLEFVPLIIRVKSSLCN